MQLALNLALRNLGQTWPNPCVAALIVKKNTIVGRGVTARGGRPHAETIALAQAGARARDATLYVTLEPCAHTGQTPPCTQTIIQSGIKRVVVATTDPDLRVNGQGIAQLCQAGTMVVVGICANLAKAQHQGFFQQALAARPLLALKLAVTRDGFMTGKKPQITGELARQHVHLLRARYDAIMVGIGTVLADDPQLNVRLAGQSERSPLRMILDRQLRLPPHSRIAQTAKSIRTIVYSEAGPNAALGDLGIEVQTLPPADDASFLRLVLEHAAKIGITRILAEGGHRVARILLDHHLVDRLYVFRAPVAAGLAGRFGVGELGIDFMSPLVRGLTLTESVSVGADDLRIYARVPDLPLASEGFLP